MDNKTLVLNMENKVAELAQLVESKAGKKNPDYYKTLKEYRMARVIYGLLGAGIDADTQKWLEEYSSGVTGTNKIVIVVQEGDMIMDLMQKYEDVKDVYHRMMKAADEVGLKPDFAKGIFVKK